MATLSWGWGMNRTGPASMRRATRAMLAFALALPMGSAGAGEPSAGDGAHTLAWQGHVARMQARGDGWQLRTDASGHAEDVRIPAQPLRSDTASTMFDGLFALAQDELSHAQVERITDSAFDDGRAIACPCFETGEKWRYVWTRDVSYAIDLALWRLAPQRSRDSLRFKLSDVRAPGVENGLYVAQDTGSGGSWPISSDRVVWFLAARHLIEGNDADARRFDDQVWQALIDTLAQDRRYVFDAQMGLYRGETSFLDWREQSYPRWTGDDVAFIAQSFALSTNALQYQALRMAQTQAARRGDARADEYGAQARALAQSIDRHFWREDRGLYMSYIGTAAHPVPFEAYDLLGLSLLVDSGIAPPQRARSALANYPLAPAGSPVIWPQQPDIAIYHNRAIWPFVSAYALRAARRLDDAARIEHEIRSLMRGAAQAGSNMENFELTKQAVHVDDGALSGPVVNSRRQLWSVAGYLQMVIEGVFGVEADGAVAPKIPVALVPMLFGKRDRIALTLPDREIVLQRPAKLDGNLLIAGKTRREGRREVVTLVASHAPHTVSSSLDGTAFAPPSPDAPQPREGNAAWTLALPAHHRLYVDGVLHSPAGPAASTVTLPVRDARQCFSLTRVEGGIESLHGPTRCIGNETPVDGAWPRTWRAPASGRYSVRLDFRNTHGPINTGITAAVKWLDIDCEGAARQEGVVVMPHGADWQRSSEVVFDAGQGAQCRIALRDGFNMSYLSHFAHYTGGQGGRSGPLNAAETGVLRVQPLTPSTEQTTR